MLPRMPAYSDSMKWEDGDPLPSDRIDDPMFWPRDGREIELLIMEVRKSRTDPPFNAEQLRAALADAVQEIDNHNREYKHVTPDAKLNEWRRLSSPDGEGMPAIFTRLDAIG